MKRPKNVTFYRDIMQHRLKEIYDKFQTAGIKDKPPEGAVPSVAWLQLQCNKAWPTTAAELTEEQQRVICMVNAYAAATNVAVQLYCDFIQEWGDNKVGQDKSEMLKGVDKFVEHLISKVSAEFSQKNAAGQASVVQEAVKTTPTKGTQGKGTPAKGTPGKGTPGKITPVKTKLAKSKRVPSQHEGNAGKKRKDEQVTQTSDDFHYAVDCNRGEYMASVEQVFQDQAELLLHGFAAKHQQMKPDKNTEYSAQLEKDAFNREAWAKVVADDELTTNGNGMDGLNYEYVDHNGINQTGFFSGIHTHFGKFSRQSYATMFVENREDGAEDFVAFEKSLRMPDNDTSKNGIAQTVLTVGGRVMVTAETNSKQGEQRHHMVQELISSDKVMHPYAAVILDGMFLKLDEREELKKFFREQIWGCVEEEGAVVLVYMPVPPKGQFCC